MSNRLKFFTLDELRGGLVFRLDLAETLEALDEVTAELRDETIQKLTTAEAAGHSVSFK